MDIIPKDAIIKKKVRNTTSCTIRIKQNWD